MFKRIIKTVANFFKSIIEPRATLKRMVGRALTTGLSKLGASFDTIKEAVTSVGAEYDEPTLISDIKEIKTAIDNQPLLEETPRSLVIPENLITPTTKKGKRPYKIVIRINYFDELLQDNFVTYQTLWDIDRRPLEDYEAMIEEEWTKNHERYQNVFLGASVDTVFHSFEAY